MNSFDNIQCDELDQDSYLLMEVMHQQAEEDYLDFLNSTELQDELEMMAKIQEDLDAEYYC